MKTEEQKKFCELILKKGRKHPPLSGKLRGANIRLKSRKERLLNCRSLLKRNLDPSLRCYFLESVAELEDEIKRIEAEITALNSKLTIQKT